MKPACHRFSFALFALFCGLRFAALAAVVLCVGGCAILPKGPVVTHSVRHYQGRCDGLVCEERWSDQSFTRGFYWFTDPALTRLHAVHTNQSALGGGSVFSAGTVTITVDTNTAPILGAAGTAAGNIIGAAAKSAIK